MWHSLTFFFALIHWHSQKSWCYLLINCHSPVLHLSIWPWAVQLLRAPSPMSWKRLCGFSCTTRRSVSLCLGSAFPFSCAAQSCLAAGGAAANCPCGLELPVILLCQRFPHIRVTLNFPCSCCSARSLPCLRKQEVSLLSWEAGQWWPSSVLGLAWTWTDSDL